jgi:hypothetical protein
MKCNEDMLIVDISERFVDVSGLVGHQEIKLHIAMPQAVINIHKAPSSCHCYLPSMTLLDIGKVLSGSFWCLY